VEAVNYCTDLPDNYLIYVGREPGANNTLSACEGDCDGDSECDEGLVCQSRDGNETIPDCEGFAREGSDYCRYPDSEAPSTSPPPSSSPSVSLKPIGKEPNADTSSPTISPVGLPALTVVNITTGKYGNCEGDCPRDNKCEGDLRCYKREAFEPVPGCSGLGVEAVNYCTDLPDNYLIYVGREPGANNTLSACEGDCDGDSECDEGLVCQSRDGNETIPGCEGFARDGSDYCRYPDVTLSPTNSPIERDPNFGNLSPTRSPTEYYEYNNIGTTCPHLNEPNVQGPLPFSDKSNVALQFYAYGDSPYDASRSGSTCIGEDGATQFPCTLFDCALEEITISGLPVNNTCTYVGKEYACNRDSLIPFMNAEIEAGEAAFVLHAGDILSEYTLTKVPPSSSWLSHGFSRHKISYRGEYFG